MKRVIIGNSHAAIAALESIHKEDLDATTVLLSEEQDITYSPTCLPAFIAGEIGEDRLSLRDSSFYNSMNAKLLSGMRVEDVDLKNRTIAFSHGGTIAYDQLLVATGCRAAMPPIEGLNHQDVYTLRRLHDARRILDKARESRSVVIYGAGLVGMELAAALRTLGLDVTVIVRSRVLRLYFDADIASIIHGAYEDRGISIRTDTSLCGMEKGANGVRVMLEGGDHIDADFLVVATGVTANVDFLPVQGVTIDNGIVVDEGMRTSDPSVFAAGDVAEVKSFFGDERTMPASLWHAVMQGKTAGRIMSGQEAQFPGGLTMNSFKFFHHGAYSMGLDMEAENGYTILKAVDKEQQRAKKLIVQDENIVGCSMVNQPVESGLLRTIIMQRWNAQEIIADFDDDFADAVRRTALRELGKEMDKERNRR